MSEKPDTNKTHKLTHHNFDIAVKQDESYDSDRKNTFGSSK